MFVCHITLYSQYKVSLSITQSILINFHSYTFTARHTPSRYIHTIIITKVKGRSKLAIAKTSNIALYKNPKPAPAMDVMMRFNVKIKNRHVSWRKPAKGNGILTVNNEEYRYVTYTMMVDIWKVVDQNNRRKVEGLLDLYYM